MTFDKEVVTCKGEIGNQHITEMRQETYTRDYWLRLYAGMAMMGLSVDSDIERAWVIDESKLRAQLLVDKMFEEEPSPRVGSETRGSGLGTQIRYEKG